jgi:toxin YoeB
VNGLFTAKAWDDYQYWVTNDRTMLKRINRLIEECRRTAFEGTGKPER